MEDYKLYAEDENYLLFQGKMQDVIDNCLEENSIDCIITDPPYGLTSISDRYGKEGSAPAQYGTDGAFKRLTKGFMGQTWDGSGVEYDVETWKRCLKVLKPGGYLLAFAGSRTMFRIGNAIEEAGFEIRDTIMWLYGSAMPKATDIGLMIDKRNGVKSKIVGYEQGTMPDFRDVGKKQKELGGQDKLTFGQVKNSERKEQPIYEAQNEWAGWKSSLKPMFEPIIMARKPFKGSLTDNVLENGVGALNIEECRIGDEVINVHNAPKGTFAGGERDRGSDTNSYRDHSGRYPGNVIHDGSEEATQFMPNTKGGDTDKLGEYGYTFGKERDSKPMAHGYNDEGSAARYFYTPKASTKDRDEGLEEFEKINIYTDGESNWGYGNTEDDNFGDRIANVKRANIHPTVKPTDLMQYLIRLVAPPNAVILDPFMGSGSTGKAAMFENRERNKNYTFVGIEMTEQYLPICKARIDYAKYKYEYDQVKEKQELAKSGQNTLF